MSPHALERKLISVIGSCRTQAQLGNAYRWSVNVLSIWSIRESYEPLVVTAMAKDIMRHVEASADRLAREGKGCC